jgi:hypothetical protein
VLLAEDNEVNQLLAKSILQYWGVETRIAVTGAEVLNLMLTEDFDLILMDIQMPEKSGIEAASEIRKLKDLKKKNTPIIALTANALLGEEKKYREAGMDDFLTKPFKERELHEVVERVLRKEGAFNRTVEIEAQDHEEEVVVQANTIEKLYDMRQVEEIASGNQDFILTLVNIFLETIPANCSEMLEASKTSQWDKVSKLAHKVKSTIDTMEIVSIRTDIRTIEHDAKKEINLENIKRLVIKVNEVIQNTAQQLKQEFSL